MSRFRYEYGAHPLHLLVGVVSCAVAALALVQVLGELSSVSKFVIWFVGAIVLHDLLFLPLYSALGFAARGVLVRGEHASRLRIAALNHLRVPAILSALAFLVWYPMILAKADAGFERTTGLTKDVYLERWLLLCAVLFVGSALLLAIRARGLRAQP